MQLHKPLLVRLEGRVVVAIIAGKDLGLVERSLNTLGVLGNSVFDHGSSRAIVNVVNGNLVLQTQDAQLAGRGADLFARRTYNSLGVATDGDQDRWRWGYEQTVRFQGPGTPVQPGSNAVVVRTEGDGHETSYTWDATRAAYVGAEGGVHDELRYDAAASEWVWIDGATRVTERYSDASTAAMKGRLVRRTDTNNSINLTYDGDRLVRIQDTGSRQELRLTYAAVSGLTRPQRLEARPLIDDTNGHATEALGDPLRLVDYDYDSQGRLTTVTRKLTLAGGNPAPANFIIHYSYDGSSTRIASVKQSDGTSLSFSYDADGKVSAVKDHGGAPGAQMSFAYGPPPNHTAITDGDGQVWTYRYDETTGHLTEVLTPPVSGTTLSTKFEYDEGGNLIGILDPRNNAVTYGYDNVGNRALDRDAIGNTTTRTFDPLNQLLTESRYQIADPDGVGPLGAGDPVTTRYVYDAHSRLRFEVSGEGRVTENRYGSPNAGYGLLTQTLLYLGQLFDIAGLGPTDQLPETKLTEWVLGLPDKTQVQLTEYSYDLRGNISQQTSYATVSIETGGVMDHQATVAEYVYDAYSNLRQRIFVRGINRDQRTLVTSLEYDGVTRVLKSSSANGTQTTVYDDANGRVTVTTASSLAETREYDSRCRLVRVSQTGDGTTRQTRYVYDNADRLRMVEDANGGRRYQFFDAVGRLQFKVDAIGAVTRFEHNDAGHLVRQTQYLNRATTDSWYDSSTQTVKKRELTVGGVGSDVIVDAAHDRVTTFDYDEAGRLTASTDSENTVTNIVYDGLSRVIMTQTGERVTRYLYDKDNRRVGLVDALRYLSEYKYDAGGRLIETVRYSQRSPASADGNELSVWRPTDTTALHSYLYYDGQGQVVGAVDEQQFLTETIYNDALNTQQTLRYLTPVTVAPDESLTTLKSRAGVSLQISQLHYDDFGRVREVTGLDRSTVTRNEYDEAGRLTRVVSAADTSEERTRYTFYNAFGEVRASLGGEGNAWLDTADVTPERIAEAIRDYGIRYEYDTLGRRIRSVDANGNRTLFYYDRESRRTHTVHVVGMSSSTLAGEVAETTYNSFGEVISTRRYSARIANSDINQLLAEGGGGHANQSFLDKLAVMVDPELDQLNFYEYDRRGRLVKQVDGEGGFTENRYNAHGELAAQVRSTQNSQTTIKQFDYDLNGRLVSETDDVGGINANIRKEYDAFGRVIQYVDAEGEATTTSYENFGRRIVITNPLQHTTSTEYDALARASVMTNALGQQTVYTYEETARIVEVTTPEGFRNKKELTRHGETKNVWDGRGNLTQYEYNRDGQQTFVIDALGRSIVRTRYDRSGRIVDQGDGNGAFASFNYDQRNRVIGRRFDAHLLNLTTIFEFDALGNQIKIIKWAPTVEERLTTYTYDRKGRTKTIVVDAADDGLKLCTTYRYDDLDNVLSIARGTESSPNQHVMLYEFDNLGRRVKEVAAPASVFGAGAPGTRDLTTQHRYDANGLLTRQIDGNGQSTWHVYDGAGREIHRISALGEVSQSRYDAAGRLVYSCHYLNRLGSDVVGSFGDLVSALTTPTRTPDDQRSHVVYDADGQVRFNLKAAGVNGWVISENRFDANGNIIELRKYDRYLPNAFVEALDSTASSGITVLEIQQELSSTLGYRDDDPTTLTGVQRTFYAYDATDRLHFTVDPLGAVVESLYDPVGNLLATVRFAVRPSLVDHTEVEIEAAVDREDPDNSVIHYAYDRADRLRYTVDPLGFLNENEFDGRGNVVKTIRRAKRTPLTEYTEIAIAAVLSGIPITETDQVTHFVYDKADRLRFTVDATGV
jgi:YD repeat-containing protein